jgi:hypothetical protein
MSNFADSRFSLQTTPFVIKETNMFDVLKDDEEKEKTRENNFDMMAFKDMVCKIIDEKLSAVINTTDEETTRYSFKSADEDNVYDDDIVILEEMTEGDDTIDRLSSAISSSSRGFFQYEIKIKNALKRKTIYVMLRQRKSKSFLANLSITKGEGSINSNLYFDYHMIDIPPCKERRFSVRSFDVSLSYGYESHNKSESQFRIVCVNMPVGKVVRINLGQYTTGNVVKDRKEFESIVKSSCNFI